MTTLRDIQRRVYDLLTYVDDGHPQEINLRRRITISKELGCLWLDIELLCSKEERKSYDKS